MDFGGGLGLEDDCDGRVGSRDMTGSKKRQPRANTSFKVGKVYFANSMSESVTVGAQSLRTNRMFRGGAGHWRESNSP